jgi:2-polyprenyl-6-methoxyphenol hydroxylase-like FAD-dependent oxidoreductase
MDFGGGSTDGMELAGGPMGEVSPLAPVRVDVAVVGAGLSGALLTLALARAGTRVAVVDANPVYKSDFRCEKLHAAQIATLAELGVLDAVEAGFPAGGRASDSGFRYDRVVNAVRAAWPDSVRFITGQVTDVVVEGAGDDQRQRLVSVQGDLAHARLVVLATGPSPKLAARLGVTRRSIRDQQSICIGFTLAPKDGGRFAFDGLVHPGERAGDKVGFVSLFKLGEGMRCNAFTYHGPREPWVRELKRDPLAAISRIAPRLAPVLAGARLIEPLEMRVTDLYRAEGYLRPGVVMIGDVFQTSCPSTAYGVTRLLSDIRQLVRAHLPGWLETPGMDTDKIAAFYADPAKIAVDEEGLRKAATARAAATETSLRWRAYRLAAGFKRKAVALRQRRIGLASNARPLVRGDWVRVRSAAEIVATLDVQGRLDGLPFMPEMTAFIGQRLRVVRRANKTCVEGNGLRGMSDTVFLEATRCGGAFHDGCERGCLMFWKRAWLAPADAPASPVDPIVEEEARSWLESLPVRDHDRYVCQSTELAAAQVVDQVSYLPARHRIGRRGELGWVRLGEIFARTLVNMARRQFGLPEIGALSGTDGKTRVSLKLQPGDRVRIRPPAEIAATLDPIGKNGGLSFEPEMTTHTRRVYTVAAPVKKIIIETSGRMAHLKSTVSLKGVDCAGRCARNCPRANPLYWREAWLERE